MVDTVASLLRPAGFIDFEDCPGILNVRTEPSRETPGITLSECKSCLAKYNTSWSVPFNDVTSMTQQLCNEWQQLTTEDKNFVTNKLKGCLYNANGAPPGAMDAMSIPYDSPNSLAEALSAPYNIQEAPRPLSNNTSERNSLPVTKRSQGKSKTPSLQQLLSKKNRTHCEISEAYVVRQCQESKADLNRIMDHLVSKNSQKYSNWLLAYTWMNTDDSDNETPIYNWIIWACTMVVSFLFGILAGFYI